MKKFKKCQAECFGLKKGLHENGSELQTKKIGKACKFYSVDSIWWIKSMAYRSESSTYGLHGTTLTNFPCLDTYMSGPCEVFTFVNAYPLTKFIASTSYFYYIAHCISKFFYLTIITVFDYWKFCNFEVNNWKS